MSENEGGPTLTDAEREAHVCCVKHAKCHDDHFHQRDVERILADRLAAERARTAEALADPETREAAALERALIERLRAALAEGKGGERRG